MGVNFPLSMSIGVNEIHSICTSTTVVGVRVVLRIRVPYV